jgi:hypothetical protein
MRFATEWLAAAAIAVLLTAAGADLAILLNREAPHARSVASRSWQPPLVLRAAQRTADASPSTPSPGQQPAAPKLAADSVAIPAQRVVAPIVAYCQIIEGGLEPPADVHEVCYWAGGAGLGEDAGTSVLTGHINWVGQGTGAFGNLGALRSGELVYTSDANRAVTAWRIVRVQHRPKTLGIDPDAFIGDRGARRLYLISCGGAFDAADLSYVDNIYVLAEPVQAPQPTPAAPPPLPRMLG